MSAGEPGARALGILGGTFNPPHLGHIALARHALDELALDRVLLVPAHTSPHKSGAAHASAAQDPGPEHRLRMCQLAIEDVDGLGVCDIELERGGLSYTVDTLTAIHANNPDAALTLIVGSDTASTISSWRRPQRLLELAQLAVAARAGAGRERVLDALEGARVRFLEMPAVAVSSSLVRERVARGEAIEDLVGAAVARYIEENGLYRARAGTVA
ncbi:MAG TPA: nicotinate-nucleotide adenylyltransferase [Solirubrobacteraceae bacterium]|nr:nicotinate-nucleotide adenylyltransferase [Solirubrobacteraceae bacterium]